MATVLCLGDLIKATQFSEQLDTEIEMRSGYETEQALAFAEQFEIDDGVPEDDEMDDKDYSATASNEDDDSSGESQRIESKKRKLAQAEASKLTALRNSGLSSTPKSKRKGIASVDGSVQNCPSISNATLVTTSIEQHSASDLIANSVETPTNKDQTRNDDKSNQPECDTSVATDSDGGITKSGMALLLKKVDQLTALQKEGNKALRDIARNTDPSVVLDTDMELMGCSGKTFRIDELTATNPSLFALSCVDKMMGKEYIKLHRFEQRNVDDLENCVAADAEVIEKLKAALVARFGTTHWYAVRLSLNQASKDRANPAKRSATNKSKK